jgi:hypothetical protein
LQVPDACRRDQAHRGEKDEVAHLVILALADSTRPVIWLAFTDDPDSAATHLRRIRGGPICTFEFPTKVFLNKEMFNISV